MTSPSWEKPGVEDYTERLDITELLNHRGTNRHVVFAGTDYGLVTMSQTIALTIERLRTHIALYNRFNVLQTTTASNSSGEDITVANSGTS